MGLRIRNWPRVISEFCNLKFSYSILLCKKKKKQTQKSPNHSIIEILTYLHCPSVLLHSEFIALITPLLEQLHFSQPVSGWYPKCNLTHTSHLGLTVCGGQIHFPVISSQRRLPQLQAANKNKNYFILKEYLNYIHCSCWTKNPLELISSHSKILWKIWIEHTYAQPIVVIFIKYMAPPTMLYK